MTKKTSSNIKDIALDGGTRYFFTFLRHESIKRLIKMLGFFLVFFDNTCVSFFFKYMVANSDSVKKVT